MASLAQQESESLSKNVKISMQYRFQQGKVMVNCSCFLGYDKDENGNLVVNPEQAEIVKRIFREYLEGASCKKIAKGLERDGILTARGKPRWHDTTVRQILENEKYMGDALLQKTYTTDFLKKKRVKNNGIMPQYYVTGNHEAIIPKDLFMLVQEEMVRRRLQRDENGKKRGFSANHCFTNMIFCEKCGKQFNRIHWNNRGKRSVVWRCSSRLAKGSACTARTLNEELIKSAFSEAISQMHTDKKGYIKLLKDNLEKALNTENNSIQYINSRLEELQRLLIDKANNHEDYTDLANEIFSLKEQKQNSLMDESSRTALVERIEELKGIIESQPTGSIEFDETLVKHLLEKITVSDNFLVLNSNRA